MSGSKSCIHPIYIYLTGATRLREGWFGRLIMQVELVDGGWRDATARDLKQIEFIGSSSAQRRTEAAQREKGWESWPDWRAGRIGGNGLEWS